jgi:hypothetical protein
MMQNTVFPHVSFRSLRREAALNDDNDCSFEKMEGTLRLTKLLQSYFTRVLLSLAKMLKSSRLISAGEAKPLGMCS